ncbi:hypothetical protein WN72_11305 [Bradyrhizobium arachidis]|uniref:Uncharacterized protein n=1 Tax=Bradyrhizobium arachidis TaxID=858423 RepID=A0AAE7TFJ2_9BRAD|nr:hypothetical protein WN72_11305 [Bradyrhizobium arachidis]
MIAARSAQALRPASAMLAWLCNRRWLGLCSHFRRGAQSRTKISGDQPIAVTETADGTQIESEGTVTVAVDRIQKITLANILRVQSFDGG